MVIDLIILGAILLFGLLGALTGGASQLAQLFGMVIAYLCARPLGAFLGPRLAQSAGVPILFGVLAATVLVFLVVLIASKIAIGAALRRLMAGKDPEDRSVDRTLGLLLGAVKIAVIAWVLVSALAFVEDNVTVSGRRLGVSPKDSFAFQLARRFNLFEMTSFAPVNDLITVSKSLEKPENVQKLRANPAMKSIQDDPRFQKAMADEQVQRAIEQGDYRALLRSNAILQLIQDPTFAARLAAAAEAAE